ncbi:36792_t:CDS:2 [Gigaspora margarita]|uniref:36792_t:CDS:1 n=1 Tax=Gigaspora margarita TaxID=4874 RepID=A0ABN7UYS9_GIGMA|nr:36792_t:CDS:2 [Gigaspora margarita]
MTKRKQKQNESVLSNMETDSRTSVKTSSSTKAGCLPTGVWKFFEKGASKSDANSCKKVPKDWRCHFNYIIVNNLEDVPTDEPLYGMSNTVSPLPSKQLIIDKVIVLAFIMCGIPFYVISNPFFINALNLLIASYEVPSREVLSGCLLDTEIAKIINKVDKILDHTNNLTIGINGWTAPNGLSIWNFIIMTPSRQEYLYELGNYSNQSYIAEFLANQIKKIINHIGSDKISAIISDNKRIIQRASKIVTFFKKSHRAAAILNQMIMQNQINGDEEIQKNHSEIISSTILTILCGQGFFTDIQYHSEVLFLIRNAILAVKSNNATLVDCYINLMKIASAIQNLSSNEYKGFRNYCIGLKFGTFSLIANYAGKLWQQIEQEQYINGKPNPYAAPYRISYDTPLMWWNTCEIKPNYLQCLAIKLFSITPKVDRLEGLAKIYQFNLSNPAEQLRYIHITEVSPKIIANIAESVFKELEEKTLLEDDVELSNPSEDLYSDEPNLNLKISNIIDLQSSVFTCTHSRTSFEDLDRDESDNNDMQDDGKSEYNVDKIVARQLDYDLDR